MTTENREAHPLEEAIHVSEWNEYTKHLEPRILVGVGTIDFKTIKQLVNDGYIICDRWHGRDFTDEEPIKLEQVIERNIYSDYSEFEVDYCDRELLGAICFKATDGTGGCIVEYNFEQKAKFLGEDGAGMVCCFSGMIQRIFDQ